MAAPRNRRPGFSRRAQYSQFLAYVIAVAGALVAAVLLLLSRFDPPAFSAFRSGVAEITAPISWAAGGAWSAVASVPESIGSYFGVHGENARLKDQVAKDSKELLRARAIAFENVRLKKLLALREPGIDPVVSARLVSSTASSSRRIAMLYAGLAQGVHAGMPVQAGDGLVGRILEAGPDTARVLMLIDPDSIVPVRRTRDGAAGFVTGRGDGLLDVKAIAMNADFAVGDVLVTSGSGGIFPPNIPVAKVTARDRDGTQATPFAAPDAFDYAIVLRAYLPPPPAAAQDTRP
jgi:rod shape-determining protein MreC